MRTNHPEDWERERKLDRDEEREPRCLHRRATRNSRPAQLTRLLDLMCGAIEIDDAGELQPPVKLGDAA